MTKTIHNTPTPWNIVEVHSPEGIKIELHGENWKICDLPLPDGCEKDVLDADAAYIVKAANEREELIEMLEAMVVVGEAGFGKPMTISKAQVDDYVGKIKRAKIFLTKVGAA